jgi:hypothetical protein
LTHDAEIGEVGEVFSGGVGRTASRIGDRRYRSRSPESDDLLDPLSGVARFLRVFSLGFEGFLRRDRAELAYTQMFDVAGDISSVYCLHDSLTSRSLIQVPLLRSRLLMSVRNARSGRDGI